MSNTVIGIFEYTSEAQEAKQYLVANGFADSQVDLKVSASTNNPTQSVANEDTGDKISNFFKNLFSDDEHEANRYSDAARRGTIVTVHAKTADEAEVAARVLDNYGAVDVNETAGSFNTSSVYGTTTTTDSIYDATADTTLENKSYVAADEDDVTDKSYLTSEVDATNTTSIPVIEEELHVGKREVTTGGVRLKSRIVERPVEESIRLREEYVTVERTPVDRLATESDFDTFKEGTIEVVEHAEVPVVSKEARIVEEISLGKLVEERDEVISDTVRSTQVETEKISGNESYRKTDSDL